MKYALNIYLFFLFLRISNFANAQLQVLCPDSLNFFVSDTLCEMPIDISKSEVIDNCGQGVDFSIWGDFSEFENYNISVGDYLAKVKISDECGEAYNCFFDIVKTLAPRKRRLHVSRSRKSLVRANS